MSARTRHLEAARRFQGLNQPAATERRAANCSRRNPGTAKRWSCSPGRWCSAATSTARSARCDALSRAWPAEPRYLTKLAELALRTGASGLARAAYERLIAMHPRVPLFRYLFAKVLTEANAPREALAEYARALELGIDQPEETLVCMASLHSALHETAQAEALLQRATGCKPDYVPALFNLATLVEERGERATALALYERVIALDPGFEQVFARVAQLRRFERADDPLIGRMLAELDSPRLSAGRAREPALRPRQGLRRLRRVRARLPALRRRQRAEPRTRAALRPCRAGAPHRRDHRAVLARVVRARGAGSGREPGVHLRDVPLRHHADRAGAGLAPLDHHGRRAGVLPAPRRSRHRALPRGARIDRARGAPGDWPRLPRLPARVLPRGRARDRQAPRQLPLSRVDQGAVSARAHRLRQPQRARQRAVALGPEPRCALQLRQRPAPHRALQRPAAAADGALGHAVRRATSSR